MLHFRYYEGCLEDDDDDDDVYTAVDVVLFVLVTIFIVDVVCLGNIQAVKEVPDSLVRELEGNDSMRSKFEALCRQAQNDICKQIEELDGEGTVRPIGGYARYVAWGGATTGILLRKQLCFLSGKYSSMLTCCWDKLLGRRICCWGRLAQKSATTAVLR